MANVTAPRGFSPLFNNVGSPYNGQHQLFLCPAADGVNAIFVGDIVQFGGSAGTAGTFVSGVNCEGIPTCTKLAVDPVVIGQDIAGVVVGFLVDPTNLSLAYRVNSTNRIALVCTDPTVIYAVQEDGITTPLAAVDIGLNVAYHPGAGNTATGRSTATIQSTSKNVSSVLPLKLLGLVKQETNAFNTAGAGSDQANFLVQLNTTWFAPNVVGKS